MVCPIHLIMQKKRQNLMKKLYKMVSAAYLLYFTVMSLDKLIIPCEKSVDSQPCANYINNNLNISVVKWHV